MRARHVVDEARELDAAVGQARAMATTRAQQVLTAQDEATNKSIERRV